MNVYRVTYTHPDGSLLGYSFHKSKRDAAEARAAFQSENSRDYPVGIEQFAVERTAVGVIAALNKFTSTFNRQ